MRQNIGYLDVKEENSLSEIAFQVSDLLSCSGPVITSDFGVSDSSQKIASYYSQKATNIVKSLQETNKHSLAATFKKNN